MNKCKKCGTEFEGKFCPECGEPWLAEGDKICPNCRTVVKKTMKFCPECGYSFEKQSTPEDKRPAKQGKPLTASVSKLYANVSGAPTVLLGLLSGLLFLFFLAPVAVMPGGELMGESVPAVSYGNVYALSEYKAFSLNDSLAALIAFAALALFTTFLIVISCAFSKIHYKRLTIAGKQVFLRNVLTAFGYICLFALFLISCILFGQIASKDGGLGVMKAGSAPILVLVFTLICCLAAVGCAIAGSYLRKTYPALVTATEEKIAAVGPTAIETWLKKHKKPVLIVFSVTLVAAIVIGIAVPVGLANRHNGTYYAYNGETEEYDMTRYYKLTGDTWEDENGAKGKIAFDGEKVTLTEDIPKDLEFLEGLVGEEGTEGTIDGDVLKIGGMIYAKKGHEHSFGGWEVTDAGTCIQKATETHSCVCGRREVREADMYGDHVYVNGKVATCAEPGVDGEYCYLCGTLSSSAEYIPALHVRYGWSSSGRYVYVSGLSNECDHPKIVIPTQYPNSGKLYPVKEISDGAFRNCSSLTSIVIPDSVTTIGDNAFYGCSGLKNVTIPDGVTHIGENAFEGIDASNWDESGVLYIGNHLIEAKNTISGEYTIRTGTKTISDKAFWYCTGLTSIIIPDGMAKIGEYAFNGCSGLTKIEIPDSVTEIGDWAFTHTAYYEDQSNWDEGCVLYIGNHLIEAKNSISGEYTIRIEIKTIPNNAFYNCSGLTKIIIPDGVTEIGDLAFYACSGLTGIIIPDGVIKIGDMAFQSCSRLTDIQFKGTVAEWQAIETGKNWNRNVGDYVVTCTDGTVKRDGTVTYFE